MASFNVVIRRDTAQRRADEIVGQVAEPRDCRVSASAWTAL